MALFKVVYPLVVIMQAEDLEQAHGLLDGLSLLDIETAISEGNAVGKVLSPLVQVIAEGEEEAELLAVAGNTDFLEKPSDGG